MHKQWADDKKKVVLGQAYMQVSVDDVKLQVFHQDDYDFKGGLTYIQTEGSNKQAKQQQQREMLKPSYLYLDLMSSFNQMFEDKHLSDVKEVSITLCGKCNAGMIFSNEKEVYLWTCSLCGLCKIGLQIYCQFHVWNAKGVKLVMILILAEV